MIRLPKVALFLTALLTPGIAAAAQGVIAAARQSRAAPVPEQLDAAQRAAYRAIFADIEAGQWARANSRLAEMRDGPLHAAARAQIYTLPGSPRVEAEPVLELLARAPDMPQASALARLARTRGASDVPPFAIARRLYWLGSQPRRTRPRPVRNEPLATTVDRLIQPLIVADQPAAAEIVLAERGAGLSPEARTEFQQRIAWSYYITGLDANARLLADTARQGPGDWALQAEWTLGLAAFRMGDCEAASQAFQTVARRTTDDELAAAGYYWASRADMRCAHPERVEGHLRAAAQREETFYGLLAESALGLSRTAGGEPCHFSPGDWAALSQRSNVRTAIALIEIGQATLAATYLRHQAQIGPSEEHEALVHLAARLNQPTLQMYLATNGPRGFRMPRHDRYPAPDWRPGGGWRVDPSLAYAHALQESNFRAEAVSGAGARGLMQVRPGTAGDLVRWGRARGETGRLNDPAHNLEFGQAYMQYLSEQAGTSGLLPHVIASYNAGPAPIALWSAQGRGGGDPLLYIESIPYWETRGYVPIVLRNYWMYGAEPAHRSASRRALVQGLWPRFPGLPGPEAVRIGGAPAPR